jgi:predicted nucleic acid-binding protein
VRRSFVADASVAIAWVHPAHATPETDAMFDRLVAGDSLIVPALWPLEVANALDLASAHELTVYDAAYIELAIRRQLPLASNDDRMKQAASRSGVDLWRSDVSKK